MSDVSVVTQTAVAAPSRTDLDRLEMISSTLEVRNAVDYANAGESLKEVARMSATVEGYFGPRIKAAHAKHQAELDAAKPWRTALTRLRDAIDRKMQAWKKQEELRAAEEQKRYLQEAEDKKAQELQAAQELLEQGYVRESKMVQRQAEAHVVPTVLPAVPKIAGVSERAAWEITVTDLMEFIKAVVEGKVALSQEAFIAGELRQEPVLLLNEKVARAKAKEGNGLNWPGVKATKVEITNVRR